MHNENERSFVWKSLLFINKFPITVFAVGTYWLNKAVYFNGSGLFKAGSGSAKKPGSETLIIIAKSYEKYNWKLKMSEKTGILF